ncbi:conserved hypothetical protein [Leishmania major strain Friedlin]|uniref:Trypanosoma Tc-38 (p38) protein domain-containing protein n=1 Tax=Leishmania major TaxID=5664 RepID=E9AEE6_LEIMA|nr:conserved hypothetical protein [Leishmania major strain Friedlin]CAG9578026.1 hypothetical_protein_-_conserved [Leishmania major strain Friedlin]CBZ12625.1 conserved hypothetical protein [Leishmania major strain Friedlin]|eukprot:XP_003722367.1 conserved hypothetical protein [Leishmania major strain Friedlin]
MSNSNAGILKDVIGRSCPWWISRLLAETRVTESTLKLLTTSAQRLQLCGRLSRNGGNRALFSPLHIPHLHASTSIAEAQVIMTHGRRLRMVSRNNGDVKVHVDLSDFLSCSGTCLTEVEEEVERLAELTGRNSYTSPFWLTQPQLESHFRNALAGHSTGCPHAYSAHDCEVYENPNMFVELSCGTATTARYANLGEFRIHPYLQLSLISCISFLRVFSPINVQTRRAFDACVEWRLRWECQQSGCWCSVWGTVQDYASCGFATLDGAIGVDVFDALGNPLFLIHALCTTAPLDVYSRCYPYDSIVTSADTF